MLTSSVIDALLRRNGCGFPTVRKATETIQYVMFEYHRDTGEVTVRGPEGPAGRVFAYIDGIGADLAVLLDK